MMTHVSGRRAQLKHMSGFNAIEDTCHVNVMVFTLVKSSDMKTLFVFHVIRVIGQSAPFIEKWH